MSTKIQYRIVKYDKEVELYHIEQRRKGWFFWGDWYAFPEVRSSYQVRPVFDTESKAQDYLKANISYKFLLRMQEIAARRIEPTVCSTYTFKL